MKKPPFLSKFETVYFAVSLLIIYLFPATLALKVGFFSDYVYWAMGLFPMIEYVANGSVDPNGYRVLFSLLLLCIPAIIYYQLKNPTTLREDLIKKRKIFAFFILTFFMPFLMVISIISLMTFEYDPDYHPIVISTLMSFGMKSPFFFATMWGGAVLVECFIFTSYINWLKNMKTILFN